MSLSKNTKLEILSTYQTLVSSVANGEMKGSAGIGVATAAARCEVLYQDVLREMELDPDFKASVERIDETIVKLVEESMLATAMNSNDIKGKLDILARRRQEWEQKQGQGQKAMPPETEAAIRFFNAIFAGTGEEPTKMAERMLEEMNDIDDDDTDIGKLEQGRPAQED